MMCNASILSTAKADVHISTPILYDANNFSKIVCNNRTSINLLLSLHVLVRTWVNSCGHE